MPPAPLPSPQRPCLSYFVLAPRPGPVGLNTGIGQDKLGRPVRLAGDPSPRFGSAAQPSLHGPWPAPVLQEHFEESQGGGTQEHRTGCGVSGAPGRWLLAEGEQLLPLMT